MFISSDKRAIKKVGMNESKEETFKRIRDVRMGAKRLDQAIQVKIFFNFLGGNKCRRRQ